MAQPLHADRRARFVADIQPDTVSLASLLHEMTDRHANIEFPRLLYRAAQTSSYDRRTVAPDRRGWFANNDGRGIIRTEENFGRKEKVLFDEKGPGAVTRIWMTTSDKRGILRFYFDDAAEAQIVLPAYDMSRFPLLQGEGLLYNHTHYKAEPERTGGNTCFLPLPYARSLKITLEDNDPEMRIPHYYQVGFRTYEEGTPVRTFTLGEMRGCLPLLARVNENLLHPQGHASGRHRRFSATRGTTLRLRGHSDAIYGIGIRLTVEARTHYAEVMNRTVLQILFDGKRCVEVPLCDFFAGGVDAPAVRGWYADCDGQGEMHSRWIMPYRREAVVRFLCPEDVPFSVDVDVVTDRCRRSSNTLYFHALGRSEDSIAVSNEYNSMDIVEWNFATLAGRGIYVGDVLSVNNHLKNWFGEGDEKIWVDDDRFPSFHGTGLEDYYNCSWAPVVPFLTPYGGVPRADEETAYGRTSWLRTRMLDAIPFTRQFCFDFEMEGWSKGFADYQAVSFWYGDL